MTHSKFEDWFVRAALLLVVFIGLAAAIVPAQARGLGALNLATGLLGGHPPARAQQQPEQPTMHYQLVRQWFANGATFCQYANGTVLNIGVGVCRLWI